MKKRDVIYGPSPLGDRAEYKAEAEGSMYWENLGKSFVVVTRAA